VAGVEVLASRYPEKTIALVSHNDIIRLVLAYYLGMPTDLLHRLHVAPTSVSVVELGPTRPPLVPLVNQTEP
jgi:probable phosphoglycerate mutase